VNEVLVDIDAGVAVVTLNRPERLNAWTFDIGRQYLEALDSLAADPAVRAIVVTGAGRAFCAGADMTLLQDLMAGVVPPPDAVRPDHLMEPAVPKPVIAAINGPCVGLGLTRALYCDVRFLTRTATLSTIFARRGLVAEHGLSWLLPRLVGWSRALDLLMSGRDVDAEQARAVGLVDHVVDDALPAAVDYARGLVRHSSPAAMADMKRQVWGDATLTLEQSLEHAESLMRASFQRPDFAEGVASFLERRDPQFPPLG
jgi:enoyl-CoA hydratase/carnithine racemase